MSPLNPNVHVLAKHDGASGMDRTQDSESKHATSAPHPRQTGRIHYTRTQTVEIPAQVYERHRVASASSDPKADAFRLLRT